MPSMHSYSRDTHRIIRMQWCARNRRPLDTLISAFPLKKKAAIIQLDIIDSTVYRSKEFWHDSRNLNKKRIHVCVYVCVCVHPVANRDPIRIKLIAHYVTRWYIFTYTTIHKYLNTCLVQSNKKSVCNFITYVFKVIAEEVFLLSILYFLRQLR